MFNAKRQLWNELTTILESVGDEGIALIGDFNCVRDNTERQNCEYTFRIRKPSPNSLV